MDEWDGTDCEDLRWCFLTTDRNNWPTDSMSWECDDQAVCWKFLLQNQCFARQWACEVWVRSCDHRGQVMIHIFFSDLSGLFLRFNVIKS